MYNVDGNRKANAARRQAVYHMYNLQFKFPMQGLVVTQLAVVSMRLFDWLRAQCNIMRDIQNFEYAISKLPFASVSK